MARTNDEIPSERAERLLADRTRFQLLPDAWDELVVIMDREARPNGKVARLFLRPAASPPARLHGPKPSERKDTR